MHYHVIESDIQRDGSMVHLHSSELSSKDAISIYGQAISRSKSAGFDHTDTFFDGETVMPGAYLRRSKDTRVIMIDRTHKAVDRCEMCASYRAERNRKNADYEAACNERDARLADGVY